MSNDRTAEIWSTRLQRELLALTTTEGNVAEESEGSGSEGGNNENVAALLPPFVTVKEHELDIANGKCLVTFQIEVVVEAPPPSTGGEKPTDGDGASDEKEDASSPSPLSKTKNSCFVLVTLDASMSRDAATGKVAMSDPETYPFKKPRAILKSGSALFAEGSDVVDGDEVEMDDCDWTPSLHLSDAALNVALKIRESVRRREPYFARRPDDAAVADAAAKPTEDGNPIDALLRKFVAKSANNTTNKKTSSTNKFRETHENKQRNKTSDKLNIGDVINLNLSPYNMCAGMYSCKAIRRPKFVEQSMAEAAALQAAQNNDNNQSTAVSAFDDEDENEIPHGLGNYMRLQAGGIRKVAGAGIVGAGSVLKNILGSAKSIMEESFLMITDTNIIELRSNKLNVGSASVTFALPVSLLAKLKFRRQESISLFFKQAPDDPLIFMCPDSADAVQQIQIVLKRKGVKGKHTNAATQRAIQAALTLVADVQAKERYLDMEPTVERVNEIMSLYRQAAERFESAGDARHEEVMNHMRKFLKKPKIASILDGGDRGSPGSGGGTKPTPKGEVLSPTNCQLDADDDSVVSGDGVGVGGGSGPIPTSSTKKSSLVDSVPSFDIENEMNDLDGLLDDTDIDEESKELPDRGDDHDAVAELDAMFSAADKELAEIMSS